MVLRLILLLYRRVLVQESGRTDCECGAAPGVMRAVVHIQAAIVY